jgi:ABC-type sulfate transport system permease subunit
VITGLLSPERSLLLEDLVVEDQVNTMVQAIGQPLRLARSELLAKEIKVALEHLPHGKLPVVAGLEKLALQASQVLLGLGVRDYR